MLPFACSGLLAARAREVLDPVGRERLVLARRRDGEVGAAEEAGHRLPRRVARHHELRGRRLELRRRRSS